VVGGDVLALGVFGSDVVLGGVFRTASTAAADPVRRDNLAAIDLTTGTAKSWNPRTNDSVFALALSGSTVYAGRAFTTVQQGVPRNHLAAFDTTLSGDKGWNPNVNGTVFALAVLGGNVYAGGAFTTAGGGTSRKFLAAFGGAAPGSLVQSWNPGADATVFAL